MMADVKVDAPTDSKRADPRYPAAAVAAIKSVRLSPGDTVTLVNVSASGILVEGKTRFVPGTRLTVVFEGPVAPPQIKGRVVRCQVSAIGGGGTLQYQSAIAFEGRVELPVEDAVRAPAPPPIEEPVPVKKGKHAAAAPPPAARAYNRW
jgi:hypothetical protein